MRGGGGEVEDGWAIHDNITIEIVRRASTMYMGKGCDEDGWRTQYEQVQQNWPGSVHWMRRCLLHEQVRSDRGGRRLLRHSTDRARTRARSAAFSDS
jgi:hypothetical protein